MPPIMSPRYKKYPTRRLVDPTGHPEEVKVLKRERGVKRQYGLAPLDTENDALTPKKKRRRWRKNWSKKDRNVSSKVDR